MFLYECVRVCANNKKKIYNPARRLHIYECAYLNMSGYASLYALHEACSNGNRNSALTVMGLSI